MKHAFSKHIHISPEPKSEEAMTQHIWATCGLACSVLEFNIQK